MNCYTLHHGDCLDVLKTFADCSVDAIVTDPPYGLAFMGKQWDHGVPGMPFWEAALRVAKPGAHLLAFGGTRTYHRLACAIEDAGWEIRDCLMWVYGSGFPKSLDVSKAIDKAAGAERQVGPLKRGGDRLLRLEDGKRDGGGTWGDESGRNAYTTIPTTEAATQWQGWGTALKPAYEPIILARKPFPTTVAANVLAHGTGGLNIDGCRVEANGDKLGGGRISTTTEGWDRPWKHDSEAIEACKARGNEAVAKAEQLGRFPANFIHDGSDEVLALFPETTSGSLTGQPRTENKIYGSAANTLGTPRFHEGDSGSAARFFYCAKASKKDRDEGLDAFNSKASSSMSGRRNPENAEWDTGNDVTSRFVTNRKNVHPTVKPTDLMRYLCRLVTPPNGLVLDPFTGSGSTGKAAILEGFRFVGIEREAEYIELARARIDAAVGKSSDMLQFE